MKKILLLAVCLFSGYALYRNGYFSASQTGAFDKNGKPSALLFVGPECGDHCERVRVLMKARGIAFDEIDVTVKDGAPVANPYGITNYPAVLIGKQRILGDDMMAIASALAENFGKQALTHSEQIAMDGHFDERGRAKVVMYGTSWCPYCKQQRKFFADNNIAFDDIDVETSDVGKLAYAALEGEGYPLTYVGYRRFSGVKEGELLAAIEELRKASPRDTR